MARLNAGCATIEIEPYRRETPDSNWIDTQIVLEYHIQEQHVRFQLPSPKVSLNIEDFGRLITGIRKFIGALPVQPISASNQCLDRFQFMPLEPSFELEVSSGSYSDENRTDGIFYLEFKMSLKSLEVETLSGDQIGCVLELRISQCLDFLNELEQEVDALP